MSHYNANNVGYSPMINHGEFGNAIPSQAQFMYYNGPPVADAIRTPPPYTNSHAALQESPMLRQQEQLVTNVQQPEQYSAQTGFQHHGQQASYTVPYAASRHHSMPYSMVTSLQNSQASSTSALNAHSASPQSQWRPPDPMHSHLNPSISPTGQRYPSSSRYPMSMANTVQAQPDSVNSQQKAMVPSALIGRYQGGMEIQNENFSSSSAVRLPQQAHQSIGQVSQSPNFVQTSHVSFMHMAQSYPLTQHSSTPNSAQYNQSQMIANQNFPQNKSTPSPQNPQMRYENVSPSTESHSNSNASFQVPQAKSHTPHKVQTLSRSQGASLNQLNRDSHIGQKMSTSFSVVSSRMPETSREMHSTVRSESFPTSFTNRQDSVRQSSVSDRRSSVPDRHSSMSDRRLSAPAVVPRSGGNFNGSPCENLMYLLQNDRVQSTETVHTGRSQEHSLAADRMYRPETVNAGARSGQTASRGHSGVVSQGRGQGMVARGTGRGAIGKVAARGMVTKTSGRGMPMERRPMRGKVISNAVKASLTSDQSTYSPIHWYKHPDLIAPTYQSDIEAMRANVNSDQNLSRGVVQTSSSSQLNQRPNAIKVNVPPNTSHIGSLSTTQVKPNGTNQRNSLAETSSPNSAASSPLPLMSSHHPSLITRLHASPTLKERTSEGRERRRDITSMKQIAFRIKGEPSEAANVNSSPRGRSEDIANPECTGRPSSVAEPVGRMSSTDTTALSDSNAVSTVSAINSVISISKSTTSVSISPGAKDACQTMQRSMSVKEKSSTQESPSAQRKSSLFPPTSTQTSNSFTLSSHVNSLPSQKMPPNRGLPRKMAFEPVSGQSARDKVFSMWKAGQVVGRVPVKGKMKSKGQVSATALHKDNSPAMRGIPEKSDEEVCRISSEERDESAPTSERPCPDQERAPFYALFHGHKIMCVRSKQGNLVLVCQFLQDCFPDKGKGSVNNCINRALRIKKKLLEHTSKEKIITYLTNNGYILGKGELEPVYMINLDDARRVYHYIYKITNCSSASCVVQLEHQPVDLDAVVAKREKIIREKLRIIKKEKQSAEDKNYGNVSQASNCDEIRKVRGKHHETETNRLPVASDRNTLEKAEKRIVDNNDDDEEDESDDLIIVEGPEDPFFILSAVNEKLVGRVVNTVVGRVRSFHHKGDNYLVVPDLCGVLGYNEFMSVVEKDNVDLYSCCNDILSFLNSMQSGFVSLTSGQNSLIKEKDIGSYSYDEDSTETETNMICPVKRVSCKQEIIDEEPECSAIKQPRLEPATRATSNSSLCITSDASMTNNDSVSALSPFESTDNRKDLVTEANSSMACSNDQDIENKKGQGRELSVSETQDEENIPKISNKGSIVDEDETVMVFSTSCVNHNHSKNSTHLVTQAKEDGEKVSSHIMSMVNDTINPVEMTEVESEKTKSPKNSEDTLIADVELIISKDPHGICAKSPVDVFSKGENESNDASMQNNSLPNSSIIVLISDEQNSSIGQTLQSVTPAHTSSSTAIHQNKSILTVIDNPHLQRSNSTLKEAVNSDTHSNKKDSAAAAKSGHTISTELCSPQTLPTKVTDRRRTEPMVTLKATIPENSVLKESDKTLSKNAVISNLTSQQVSLSPVRDKTGGPLSESNKDVITPNFLAITETNPSSSSNATSTPSMPAIALSMINEKTTPGPKHRSSSCESSASCSSFLQVASSSSFKLRPKTATSALKYCPDDLELLSPRKSVPGAEAFKTKQALLEEMIVLRYKNKALQDMVKHLRRELLSSKDKNENNAKMIKYYENVLQEITASFKEGEPEVKEKKEEQQQQQPTQACGDSSAPILIDDD